MSAGYPESKEPPPPPAPPSDDVLSIDPDAMDEETFREGLELLEQLERFRSAGATDKKLAQQLEEQRQQQRRARHGAPPGARAARRAAGSGRPHSAAACVPRAISLPSAAALFTPPRNCSSVPRLRL